MFRLFRIERDVRRDDDILHIYDRMVHDEYPEFFDVVMVVREARGSSRSSRSPSSHRGPAYPDVRLGSARTSAGVLRYAAARGIDEKAYPP